VDEAEDCSWVAVGWQSCGSRVAVLKIDCKAFRMSTAATPFADHTRCTTAGSFGNQACPAMTGSQADDILVMGDDSKKRPKTTSYERNKKSLYAHNRSVFFCPHHLCSRLLNEKVKAAASRGSDDGPLPLELQQAVERKNRINAINAAWA
jgi:hypothetical protein